MNELAGIRTDKGKTKKKYIKRLHIVLLYIKMSNIRILMNVNII